jgi:hypothetical protein
VTSSFTESIVEQAALAWLENRGTYSGCWDVIAWHGKELIFAESKLKGHDRPRATQRRWFAAGIAAGLSPESFLVVEWSAA